MQVTIGRLAAAADVGVETVRFYQRRGLMPVPPRQGGFRHYDDSHARRLRFIRDAQGAGFTLKEIGELLTLDRTRARARVQQLAAARIASIDARITSLARVRARLAHLAAACAALPPGAACPVIAAFAGDRAERPLTRS